MKSFLITFKPASESPERGWLLENLQKLVRRVRAAGRVESGSSAPCQRHGRGIRQNRACRIARTIWGNTSRSR